MRDEEKGIVAQQTQPSALNLRKSGSKCSSLKMKIAVSLLKFTNLIKVEMVQLYKYKIFYVFY